MKILEVKNLWNSKWNDLNLYNSISKCSIQNLYIQPLYCESYKDFEIAESSPAVLWAGGC